MSRALLSGARILVLDEPTAHLDPQTSPQLLAELLGAAGESSVLIVSHEPGLADQVDAVVTLENGSVVTERSAAAESTDGRIADVSGAVVEPST